MTEQVNESASAGKEALLDLAKGLEAQAVDELLGWTRAAPRSPGLYWEQAKGIAAIFQCATALRAIARATGETA